MGNSQKGLKNKVRQLFSREENHSKDQKPGNVCPKCHVKFPKGTADQLLRHLEECKQDLTQPKGPVKQPEQPQGPEKVNTTNETSEHVFEKVPTNPQMTQFKWMRVPVVNTPIQLLLGCSPEQIAKRSFQQKLAWMRACLQSMRIPWQHGSDTIKVEKDNVLMTSVVAASKVNMFKEVKIQFADDKVNDAGGLLREWAHMITKEIFGEAGIFERTNTNEVMYKINWDKDLDVEFATDLFGLFGTVLGKCIFQRIPLTCYLDRALIRQICGQKVNLDDISDYDKDFYKNWKYLLTNQIQPFGQYFSVLKKHGDNSLQVIELVPGGDDLEMDESNKKEFVRRCIDFYCTQSVNQYIKAIKSSLHKIIPEKILSVFQPYQMEMILYGVPFVNVNDWKNNTEYKGVYSPDHQSIKWFWAIVDKMTQTQLCNLLHFVTGSSRIPIYGFQKLESNRGNYARMLVQSTIYSKTNPYPQAHTCFNRLELPLYPSQDSMKTYLMAIVNSNLDGVYGLD